MRCADLMHVKYTQHTRTRTHCAFVRGCEYRWEIRYKIVIGKNDVWQNVNERLFTRFDNANCIAREKRC